MAGKSASSPQPVAGTAGEALIPCADAHARCSITCTQVVHLALEMPHPSSCHLLVARSQACIVHLQCLCLICREAYHSVQCVHSAPNIHATGLVYMAIAVLEVTRPPQLFHEHQQTSLSMHNRKPGLVQTRHSIEDTVVHKYSSRLQSSDGHCSRHATAEPCSLLKCSE